MIKAMKLLPSLVILLIQQCAQGNQSERQSTTSIRPILTTTRRNNNITSIGIKNNVTTTTRRPISNGNSGPCACLDGQCGCCAGIQLNWFNQKACLNITYDPDDFSLTAAMSLNERQLYKRTVSGKNPPPLCARLPRLRFIRFCVKFSNIYFASRNVHLCVNMVANWEDLTLLEWSFDCIRMGQAGVAVIRPEDGSGIPLKPIDSVDQTDEDYDDNARIALIHLQPSVMSLNEYLTNRENYTKLSTLKNTVIFDDSINDNKLADMKPNAKLFTVKQISNGNYFIYYNPDYRTN